MQTRGIRAAKPVKNPPDLSGGEVNWTNIFRRRWPKDYGSVEWGY